MGTNSLPAPAPRRRSFSLPSFRRSSAAERQEVLNNADEIMGRSNSVAEAARNQKAAAWQWHTRGVGEALVRPTIPQAPAKSCIDGSSGPRSKGSKANVHNSSMPQEKTVERPLAESNRSAASRFKAEAGLSSTRGRAPAPSGGPSSTPLYDELELSSLRTHMADFVQRLQHQESPDNEQSSPAAVADQGKPRPPPPSVSIDHRQTKGPGAAVAVASAGDHQKLPSSPASVASSSIPFHIKSFYALQKLFRKVVSGSVPKCTKHFPDSDVVFAVPAVYEPAEVLYDDVDHTNQYHEHHYIHHHHHHYHFSKSPEEQASAILSRRRHSESGSSRPCTRSLVEAGSDEEEDQDEAEESRIAAYLARRRIRRHSDTFFKHQVLLENAGFDKDEGMTEESVKVESPMQFSRRYNSERFVASKFPTSIAQPVEDEFDEGTFAGIRSRRRRHSAELHREEPSLRRTGGVSAGGAYVLGGAGAGGGSKPAAMPMVRRRHSESSKERPEAGAKRTPSPGRLSWISPSARYYVDVQARHIGVPMPANGAATIAGLNAGAPSLYAQ